MEQELQEWLGVAVVKNIGRPVYLELLLKVKRAMCGFGKICITSSRKFLSNYVFSLNQYLP